MKSPDPDEKIFSLADIKKLYLKEKSKCAAAAILCGILCLLFLLFTPVKYKIEATFKESADKSQSDSLKEILGTIAVGELSPTAELVKSHRVLQPLISRLGLQIHVREGSYWNLFWDNIRAELGRPIRDPDSFGFTDAVYAGERGLAAELVFTDRDWFEIIWRKKKIRGRLHEIVSFGSVSFRIIKTPSHLQVGRRYVIEISPWIDTARSIRKALQITPSRIARSIIHFSLCHSDRILGARIVNELMAEYQRYLQNEHEEIAEEELTYLEKRQNDLVEKLDRAYEEHVRYLHGNVGSRGFINADQETKAFLLPYKDLFMRSFSADVEMDQLSAWQESPNTCPLWENTIAGARIHRIRQDIQDLERQRDQIATSLYFRPGRKFAIEDVQPRIQELQAIRSDLSAAKMALENIESTQTLPNDLELFSDPNSVIQGWARNITDAKDKEDFVQYLQNTVRLFSVREKILEERQAHQQTGFAELGGIDLDTAKRLVIETSRQLDDARAQIERYRHLISQMDDPDFELASLSSSLTDPLSRQILSQTQTLHLQQGDESHSEKEEGRNRHELAWQRKILQKHLEQLIGLEQLSSSIFEDKIASLEEISLDCINRQISVLNEQIASLVKQRSESLVREKEFLEKKMQQLREQMNDLPEKWRAENLLKLKSELGIKIMQTVSQLVESKTIGRHLQKIESKPLDEALAPFLPEKPNLLLFSLLGFSAGFAGCFFGLFLRALYRGFPVSESTLRALGYSCSGKISFEANGMGIDRLPENDLESLRKVMLSIDEKESRIIALLGGAGPDYSHFLAELLSSCRRKILLISCDWQNFGDGPGLQQLLTGVSPFAVRPMGGYDFLPSGGACRFGAGIFSSSSFAALLDKLEASYDHILLFNRAPALSAECEALVMACQMAVVTVQNESIELLTPLIRWAYDESRYRLTFLVVHHERFETKKNPRYRWSRFFGLASLREAVKRRQRSYLRR